MSFSRTSWASASLWLVLAGCGKTPPMPEVDLNRTPGAMRASVDRAAGAALAKPDDDKLVAELGRQLHAAMDYPTAAAAYRRARWLKKDAYEYAYLEGRASLSAGEYAQAVEAFEQAIKLKPSSIAAKLGLAETYQTQGAFNKADDAYRRLGKHALAHFGVARGLTGKEALAEYEKAVQLDPKFGPAWEAIALIAAQVGDKEKAANAQVSAQLYKKMAPTVDDPEMAAVLKLSQASNDRLRQGLLAEKEGRYAEAAQILQQAVAEDASRAEAWVTLVGVYTRLRDFAAAQNAYEKAVALGANTGDLHYNYAVGLIEANRRPEAEQFLEKAIQADAKHLPAHLNLGLLAFEGRRYERASQLFEKTLEIDPGYRSARFQLGRVRNAQKRFDDAVKLLTDTVEPLDDMTPYALHALAGALNGKGDSTNAFKLLERARGVAAERKMNQMVAEIDKDLAALKQVR